MPPLTPNKNKFSSYEEATAFLFCQLPMYQQVGKIAYKADLETPMLLDEYFGHPHRLFKSIHVAGTNGKGSSSHMLAAGLQSAGYKVGLYTSPHLKDFRERIKVNGELITEQEVLDFTNAHWSLIETAKPSFFEMATALAFDYFARQKVDVAVVETGMGGRLDATNIIRPVLSIITNIGLDHTEHLGDTPVLIAREKAGIIKPLTPVVIGEAEPDTAAVFQEVAAQLHAPLFFACDMLQATPEETVCFQQYFRICRPGEENGRRVVVDLLGDYQQKNIRTVLAALEIIQQNVPELSRINPDTIATGLAHAAKATGLRGRWEIIGEEPLTICDTGHNAHGLQYTFRQLAKLPHRQLHIVFGVVADKDLSSIFPFMPRDAHYYFTQANLPRALSAKSLAEQATATGLKGAVYLSVQEALADAKNKAGKDDIIYVGGSTFVVAEAL